MTYEIKYVTRHPLFFFPKAKRAVTLWLPFARDPWVLVPKGYLANHDKVTRTIMHEEAHVEQWRKHGRFGFARRWLFDRAWRLQLEAAGFARSARWWIERGHPQLLAAGVLTPVFEYYARALAEHYKLNASFDECRAAISAAYREQYG